MKDIHGSFDQLPDSIKHGKLHLLNREIPIRKQVEYFKFGKRKGRKQRLFKRTPIHDNFRVLPSQLDPECKYVFKWPKGAWHESKITVRFWITTIILAAFTIITLKIR